MRRCEFVQSVQEFFLDACIRARAVFFATDLSCTSRTSCTNRVCSRVLANSELYKRLYKVPEVHSVQLVQRNIITRLPTYVLEP
jgi:hypothetical protein